MLYLVLVAESTTEPLRTFPLSQLRANALHTTAVAVPFAPNTTTSNTQRHNNNHSSNASTNGCNKPNSRTPRAATSMQPPSLTTAASTTSRVATTTTTNRRQQPQSEETFVAPPTTAFQPSSSTLVFSETYGRATTELRSDTKNLLLCSRSQLRVAVHRIRPQRDASSTSRDGHHSGGSGGGSVVVTVQCLGKAPSALQRCILWGTTPPPTTTTSSSTASSSSGIITLRPGDAPQQVYVGDVIYLLEEGLSCPLRLVASATRVVPNARVMTNVLLAYCSRAVQQHCVATQQQQQPAANNEGAVTRSSTTRSHHREQQHDNHHTDSSNTCAAGDEPLIEAATEDNSRSRINSPAPSFNERRKRVRTTAPPALPNNDNEVAVDSEDERGNNNKEGKYEEDEHASSKGIIGMLSQPGEEEEPNPLDLILNALESQQQQQMPQSSSAFFGQNNHHNNVTMSSSSSNGGDGFQQQQPHPNHNQSDSSVIFKSQANFGCAPSPSCVSASARATAISRQGSAPSTDASAARDAPTPLLSKRTLTRHGDTRQQQQQQDAQNDAAATAAAGGDHHHRTRHSGANDVHLLPSSFAATDAMMLVGSEFRATTMSTQLEHYDMAPESQVVFYDRT